MSNTLNRPMFKRGPDGRLREAHVWGGLAGIPTMWRQAKFFAPKFSNIGHYWNKGMSKLGVPKATRDGLKFGVKPRVVDPVRYPNPSLGEGVQGPLKSNYSLIDEAYDARMVDWKKKLDTLMGKHNVRGLALRAMPEEVKKHWQTIPRMPKGRRRVEQIGYGIGVPMLYGWGPGYPDDTEANIKAETGSLDNEAPEDGSTGAGIDESKTTYGSGIEQEGGSPLYKSMIEMDEDPTDTQGIDYDGAVDAETAVGGDGDMADVITDAVVADDEISLEGINKYKQELKAVIGEEDKTTGTLLLMQLGLGMMAGKSDQPGFAGFAEILGKTGQEVLPMWLEHTQNLRKEDKEIGLAAYEMLREDRAAKRERESDLADWIWKEDYKNIMNPPGTLSNIMVKRVRTLPGGETDETWEILKQTHSKSPEALAILAAGDPNMRVVPLNISDAGLLAGGLGSPQGKWTDAQRGENANLAVTLGKNIGQILDFLMDPKQGLHSGNFKTGYTGRVIKGLRFITKEAQQALDAIGLKSPILGEMYTGMYGALGESTAMNLDSLVESGGIMPGAGNQMSSEHAAKGINDVWHGTAEGANGQMIEGDFATEAYVRSLTDNSLYDIEQQLTNMMGFLMARLKQPTGRLLADTIKSSIAEQSPLGGMKDPVQAANQMHFFVKTLYESYAKHAAIGGMDIETSWLGTSGPLTIQGYEQQYQDFVGDQRAGAPIDFSFLEGKETISTEGPGNIYPGQNKVTITGTQSFDDLMEWAIGGQ